MTPIELKFTLTEEEYMDAMKEHLADRRVATWHCLVLGALLMIWGHPLFFWLGLIVIICPFLVNWRLRNAFKSNPHRTLENKFQFSDSGARFECAGWSSDTNWEFISEIKPYNRHVALYMGKDQIYAFLPHRAFSSPEAVTEFVEAVRGKIQTAQ
jgi:hypothetical protein